MLIFYYSPPPPPPIVIQSLHSFMWWTFISQSFVATMFGSQLSLSEFFFLQNILFYSTKHDYKNIFIKQNLEGTPIVPDLYDLWPMHILSISSFIWSHFCSDIDPFDPWPFWPPDMFDPNLYDPWPVWPQHVQALTWPVWPSPYLLSISSLMSIPCFCSSSFWAKDQSTVSSFSATVVLIWGVFSLSCLACSGWLKRNTWYLPSMTRQPAPRRNNLIHIFTKHSSNCQNLYLGDSTRSGSRFVTV